MIKNESNERGLQLAVLCVIIVPILCLIGSLYLTWFKQEDFVILYRTTSNGGFPGSLFTPHNGHLIPGIVGMFWLLRSCFGMSWLPFVAVIAGSQLVASFLTWRVLKSFFGLRISSIFLLMIYCVSSLTLGANMWAIAAIQYLPLQIAFPATLLLLQRFAKNPNTWAAILATFPVCISALFFEKAFMIVPFVVVLCALTPLVDTSSAVWRRRLAEFRLPILLMLIWTLAYAVFFKIATSGSAGQPSFSLHSLTNLNLMPVTNALLPSLLGGPRHFLGGAFSTVSAGRYEIGFSLATLAVLFLWSVVRNLSSIKYWVFWLVLVGSNLLLIASANRTFIQLATRYMSDLVFPTVLLIGFAVFGNSLDYLDRPSRVAKKILLLPTWLGLAAAIFLIALIAANSLESHRSMVASMKFDPGKSYVQTARISAQRFGQSPVLIPHAVPPLVINPIWGFSRENTTEVILLPADINVRFGTVVEDPYMVASDGAITRAKFDLVSEPVKTTGQCLNDTEKDSTKIELSNSPFIWSWYARMQYDSPVKAHISLHWLGPEVSLDLEKGSHTLYFPIQGGGSTMTINTNSSNVCIEHFEIVQLNTGS